MIQFIATAIVGQAQIIDGELRFQGLVASVDGSQIYRSSKVGAPADAEKIGREAVREIYPLPLSH